MAPHPLPTPPLQMRVGECSKIENWKYMHATLHCFRRMKNYYVFYPGNVECFMNQLTCCFAVSVINVMRHDNHHDA